MSTIRREKELVFCDFDRTLYKLSSVDSQQSLSLSAPCLKQLYALNLEGFLQQRLGKMGIKTISRGNEALTITVETAALNDASIACLANMRRICLGLPFYKCFEAQQQGVPVPVLQVPLTDAESVWVQAEADRLTATVSVKFVDASDAVLGRVFLQVPWQRS